MSYTFYYFIISLLTLYFNNLLGVSKFYFKVLLISSLFHNIIFFNSCYSWEAKG